MNYEYSYNQDRLNSILSKNDLTRISMKFSDKIYVIVDVHGMKCSQTRRFINNIINSVRVAFQLIVIHGYNHGTAIKDMLAENFSNSHIVEQHADFYNQGVTHMYIAA